MTAGTIPHPWLAAAAAYSRYVRRVREAGAVPDSTLDVTVPFTRTAMQNRLAAAGATDEAGLRAALRHLRATVMTVLIARDLAGAAPLEEVVETVSALAEVTIGHAAGRLQQWASETYGTPLGAETGAAQPLVVIGMGKLGGGELNVSSDIDLVFVYPEDGDTSGPRVISNHEFFIRVGRQLIGALAEITADGFVFRVDMRLRPYGDAGPLAVSLGMLENYLVTQGREWERYAWLKGRALTGGVRGTEIEDLVRPFVYRRHLDYSALESLRGLHRMIREEVTRRDRADDVKVGPGGIREVEFIAQVFQLIRGGREPDLRVRPTLAALRRMGARGLLPEDAVAELVDAYGFLRRVEHRLQYLDDQQTQRLPSDDADREALALAMDCPDWPSFEALLARHRGAVTRRFEGIFAQPDQVDGEQTRPQAENGDATGAFDLAGYREPDSVRQRLAALRSGSRYRGMPASSQQRLDRLIPRAIAAARAAADPDATLSRLLDLFESIARRESYLALLIEYPHCLAAVAKLVGASRWVAEYLTRHPILLDELLDAGDLLRAPDWADAGRRLRRELDGHAGDAEREMDALRHFKQAQTLRLVAQDLAGSMPLETLSDHLSDLACLALSETTRLAWRSVRAAHREVPRFAVIGYGKLGGKELGYASDLDIIFLYDDDHPEALENYARLAGRVNTWLTTMTSAGVLYETDLRLRPDGAKGLLVSSLDAFARYQREAAWLWEHQAITRARYCAGDARVGAAFEKIRIEILTRPREAEPLRAEVVAMRVRMQDAHGAKSQRVDVKQDPGGIIDVEFIVQYLVLLHAASHRELTANLGNLALLRIAAGLGLIDTELADRVRGAYRRFRTLQHQLGLAGERAALVEPQSVAADRDAVMALWREVLGPDRPAPRRSVEAARPGSL
jgi:glutamate-ammonia-ligase adenylyltransferase